MLNYFNMKKVLPDLPATFDNRIWHSLYASGPSSGSSGRRVSRGLDGCRSSHSSTWAWWRSGCRNSTFKTNFVSDTDVSDINFNQQHNSLPWLCSKPINWTLVFCHINSRYLWYKIVGMRDLWIDGNHVCYEILETTILWDNIPPFFKRQNKCFLTYIKSPNND